MTIDPDFGVTTDEELVQIVRDINAELNRRRLLAQIPEQVAALNREFLKAEGVEQGAPWKQPTGAHDAYPKDWVTSHKAKDWVSTIDANVYEPPTMWREVTEDGKCPQWVQPVAAEDAYNTGDCVVDEGVSWVSLIDANVWRPGSQGAEALWEVQP